MIQVQATKPGLWLYTDQPSYNSLRAVGYADLLTDEQKARVERLRQAQLLFDGRHRQYYLDEGRTQYDFAERVVNGQVIKPYSTFNVLGLTSLKFADLLFGRPPIITVDDEIQQRYLDDLVKRNYLAAFLHGCATDGSYEGEQFIEAVIHTDGKVYLQQVPAIEIFPEGELGPDRQYASYVRYRLRNKGTADSPLWILLQIRYLPGRIERAAWQLDNRGRRTQQVDLKWWDLAPGQTELPPGYKPLEPVTYTGIERNTITWIPNNLVRGCAVSDYDGALDLQDRLNARDTQIDEILAKHASPMVSMPAEAARDGTARARYKVHFYTDPDRVPKYIIRDLQLDPAFADAQRTLKHLCIRLEMSPVLLGLKDGAAPDAYKKVKLEAQNALKKAERKAQYWVPGLTRALEVAQDLENTLPGVRYDRWPIAAEIQDGIGEDLLDQANRQSILRAAGLLSRRRGLLEQLGDTTATEAELLELEKEEASRTPSIFLDRAGTEPGEVTEDEEVAA